MAGTIVSLEEWRRRRQLEAEAEEEEPAWTLELLPMPDDAQLALEAAERFAAGRSLRLQLTFDPTAQAGEGWTATIGREIGGIGFTPWHACFVALYDLASGPRRVQECPHESKRARHSGRKAPATV